MSHLVMTRDRELTERGPELKKNLIPFVLFSLPSPFPFFMISSQPISCCLL